MAASTSQHSGTGPETGAAERWLGSPVRLGVLATGAAVFATAATTMGEIELREAGGFGADEWRIVWLEGAKWLGWALLAPALAALAAWIARVIEPWPLAALAHIPLALGVGCLFLGAEIKLQEWDQGPELTARWNARIEEQRRWRTEFAENPERRDALRDQWRGGRREGRPPRRDGSEFARLRDRFRRSRVNIATGDFTADFERRWLLRVPRYALVYLALVGIGLGIRSFLHGRAREREAAELQIRAADLEAALGEARLAALKGQLHPHFLFNALHSVGGLIRSERGPEALTALSSIGDLLRTSLDAGGEQFVSLERELELVRRYLDVEALRLGERLRVDFDVDEALLPCEVPAFITQPLVENAVKHGVAPRPAGGRVTVRIGASDDGSDLVVEIEDDGPGYAPKGDTENGVGVRHVRERLAALFDEGASLVYETVAGEGTRARLVLPREDFDSEVRP